MSIEELISVSQDHFDGDHDISDRFMFRLHCELNPILPYLLIKFLQDYYLDLYPAISSHLITDCIVKCFSSEELFSVLHYLIDGYLEEQGYK